MNRRLTILLVEDEEADVFFVRNAVEKSAAKNSVYDVRNAEEAIRYLRGEGAYADRAKFPFPNVLLTDLKMPGMNGFDLLRWRRDHPECSVIPTMIYSSSAEEQDVREAYALGANGYFKKPLTLDRLINILRVVLEFWSECELPPAPTGC
ncbi:MAG: response regulator [Verrucomicrobiota bacterium]